jgi:hypothetical protein
LSYTPPVERRAGKEPTRRIHPQAAERISKAINVLAEDPYPRDGTRVGIREGFYG